MEKQYCVYILTNERHTVLYTGVTSDLLRRVSQHCEKRTPGFTSRYNVDKLVFYEVTEDATAAITREKQIKAGSRRKKLDLIAGMSPEWRDLYDELSRVTPDRAARATPARDCRVGLRPPRNDIVRPVIASAAKQSRGVRALGA